MTRAGDASLVVRVDASGGAPRLTVNHKPVRARMFFGIPNAAPLPVTPAARQVQFEFTAAASEPSGATMHFRFGQAPVDIVLDDIQVTDLDTGRDVIPLRDFEGGPDAFTRDWTFWPVGAQNTVGTVRVEPGAGRDGSAGLRVRLTAPADGRWPDFHVYHHPRLALVRGHRYRVRFWARVDAPREFQVAFYRPGATFTFLGGPPGFFESQIRMAAAVGVHFVSFPVGLPWPAPGEAEDWSGVDAACEAVLRENPEALLLPRIPMDPPPWWQSAFPDEIMRWDDAPAKAHRGVAVVASPRYRRDAGRRLDALVRHLEMRFAAHVAGYHPTGQNTGEWFYEDTWGRALNGYAPADLTAWRQWLRARYRTDAALRTAWHDPAAALNAAVVPTPAARRAAPVGVFRDPRTQKPLLDWAEFQQHAMADCVRDFARVVRGATRGRKLVVFFYGYGFEFGAVPTGPATSGHYALRRVLDSPDIDVLCAPISYFDRGPGGSAPAMTAAESVALAGKLWLNEDDTATHLSSGTFPGHTEKVSTLAETNALLLRNVGQAALRNFGTWWMDLGATGWFNDPGMWAAMTRLNALDAPLLDRPAAFRPEVAAVLDERSALHVADGGDVATRPAVYEARGALGRMGAPYGQYLLDDVTRGRVRGAKLYVFLDAWALSGTQRADLLRATRGSTRVWCYAAGYIDGDRHSTDGMRQLTGFAVRTATGGRARAVPTARGRRLGLRQPFGVEAAVRPLFAASDARPEETLATYSDGSAAVALRQTPSGRSLFVGVPGLTSELLRLAARAAGVHLFTEDDCSVYAQAPFLVVHAAANGPVRIDTGRTGPVRDLLSGKVVGRGPSITLPPLRRGETRLLRY